MRKNEMMVFAVAAIGIAACGATPLLVPDGGTPGWDSGGRAGSDLSETGLCTPVLASDYDQSCLGDSDCVAVGEAPECPPTGCGCPLQSINQRAKARYMTALSRAFATQSPGVRCSCPCIGALEAVCRGGKCLAAGCAPDRTDTLPACANAGGSCGYRITTTCNVAGPPDSCAYSDELCCLK
jgi:hypothetical protein